MTHAEHSERGYAMAALLVALSVMAVLMSVAMPVWRQMAQREKEEELVFRGKQYARAIGLFERKYANTPPPTLDVLVQEHFLRKKYKDPITGGDFVPIPAGQGQAATPGPGAAARGGTAVQQATNQVLADAARQIGGRAGAGATAGGVIGVTSASNARSIRIYNGASRYSDWRFVYAPSTQAPGTGGQPAAGGRGGQRGQGPGQGPGAGQGRQGNPPQQPGGRGPNNGPPPVRGGAQPPVQPLPGGFGRGR